MNKKLVGTAIAFACVSHSACGASQEEMQKRLELLEQEMKALKSEMRAAKPEPQGPSQAAPAAAAAAVAGASSPPAAASGAGAAYAGTSDTNIGGYGEITYNRYRHDSSRNEADLRRAVLYLGHRFSDRLRFDSEIEFEHAVTSAGDKGEVALEQAFLTYQVNDALTLKTGLILMPFGFLNRVHEPSSYYGVERNDVETRIIPATWREGAISLAGRMESGFQYELGVTTSFDISKFDDPARPLASVHQELQLARAHDIGFYGAVNYRGIPGLTVGGAVFTANTTQGNAAFKADPTQLSFAGLNGRLTIWDVHARYQRGPLDLQSVFARGTIAHAADIDQRILDFNVANGASRPFVPAAFYGWYGQAAYQLWASGDMSVTPFLRYERLNTQSSMPAGFAADPLNDEHIVTAGLSFRPHPQVVLKTDYQKYRHGEKDRLNLGAGWQF